MTLQYPDTLDYQGKRYEVAGISRGNVLFDLRGEGIVLENRGFCSAGGQGYIAHFGVRRRRLVLKDVQQFIGSPEDDLLGQVIARRQVPPDPWGGLLLDYSGALRVGRNPDFDLAPSAGYLPLWAYGQLISLTFEAGHLMAVDDLSHAMAELRQGARTSPEWNPELGIIDEIRRGFDNQYFDDEA